METQTQHTPTPWSFVNTNMQTIDGIEVHRWFNAGGLPLPLTDANAAFIVRAVNSHEAFIKLANYVIAMEKICPDIAVFYAKEAIAQAEGK